MATLFLQEAEATIFLADIRDFSSLANKKGAAIELAITLSRFYEHIASVVKAEGGRVIKLCGDGVLCAFVGLPDHQPRALRAAARALATRDEMNEMARLSKMPVVDYTVVVGSGVVLAGDLGAEKLQGFDVVGATVNRVFRLSHLATRRGVSNLIERSTLDALPLAARPAAHAVAPAELEGETVTLFELET